MIAATHSAVEAKTVLLVTENSCECQELTTALQDEGISVIAASKIHDAFVALYVSRPAAILADWDLNGMDGMHVIQRLRVHVPLASKLPLMLMTDRAVTPELLTVLGRFGVRWIVRKPLAFADVANLVFDTVRSRAATR